MTREKVIERGGGDYGTGVSEERAAAATGYNRQDLCRALGLFRNSDSEDLVRLALIAAYRRGYLHGTQAEPAAPARPEASTEPVPQYSYGADGTVLMLNHEEVLKASLGGPSELALCICGAGFHAVNCPARGL